MSTDISSHVYVVYCHYIYACIGSTINCFSFYVLVDCKAKFKFRHHLLAFVVINWILLFVCTVFVISLRDGDTDVYYGVVPSIFHLSLEAYKTIQAIYFCSGVFSILYAALYRSTLSPGALFLYITDKVAIAVAILLTTYHVIQTYIFTTLANKDANFLKLVRVYGYFLISGILLVAFSTTIGQLVFSVLFGKNVSEETRRKQISVMKKITILTIQDYYFCSGVFSILYAALYRSTLSPGALFLYITDKVAIAVAILLTTYHVIQTYIFTTLANKDANFLKLVRVYGYFLISGILLVAFSTTIGQLVFSVLFGKNVSEETRRKQISVMKKITILAAPTLVCACVVHFLHIITATTFPALSAYLRFSVHLQLPLTPLGLILSIKTLRTHIKLKKNKVMSRNVSVTSQTVQSTT